MLNLVNLNANDLKNRFRKFQYVTIAALFTLALAVPILMIQNTASAQTLSSRSLQISTSQGNATDVIYTFEFNLASDGNVGSIQILFCTTALGTCTTPTGMSAAGAELNTDTDTVAGSDAGFADGTNAAGTLQVTKTPADVNPGDTVHLEFGDGGTSFAGITNPDLSGNSTSFYARITVYSDNAYTTAVDSGTVVGVILRQITVNGRVAERLDFCVGAVLDDNLGTGGEDTELEAISDNSVCTNIPGDTVVDIGVLDDSTVYISPVPADPITGANGNYGVAAVKTNASNGVVVSFFAEDAASVSNTDTDHLKAFRVAPTDCDADQTAGAGLTDQCFRSAAPTGEDFGALSGATQERFGMQVSCFDQGDGTRSTTSALSADANFADSDTSSGVDCEDDDDNSNFAWNETSTAADLASSTGVVDDEIIKFNFGATTSSTTPTGAYTVVSTYIATATF